MADASGLKIMEIEAKCGGYIGRFSAAITTGSTALMSPIFPQHPLVIYRVIAGASAQLNLFLAGMVPGIIQPWLCVFMSAILLIRESISGRKYAKDEFHQNDSERSSALLTPSSF